MGHHKKHVYLEILGRGYHDAKRRDKKKIIDQICHDLGWHRKSAIRAIKRLNEAQKPKKVYRSSKYSKSSFYHLKQLWLRMDQMCSKKMRAALPYWLPRYKQCDQVIKDEILSMSSSTIDRGLKQARCIIRRRNNTGTRPGSKQFQSRIPVKPLDHRVDTPGIIEADTVAHCGDAMNGVFAWSLTCTDVKTGWTENAAMWGKNSRGVVGGVRQAQANMPFDILQFHCDNGSEFLNKQLILFFSSSDRQRKKQIQMLRGRPYKKNDQCHVEQKNYTHVRQLMGYARIDKQVCVAIMNDIYGNIWSKLQNYFTPQMKLVRKVRIGARYRREYSAPLTPCERVIQDPSTPAHIRQQLQRTRAQLNPFELQKQLQAKTRLLSRILNNQPKRRANDG